MQITTSRLIQANPDTIAGFMFSAPNDPRWIGGIKKVELLTPEPVGRGMCVRREARFLGKTIVYVLEVEQFEPGRLMRMKSIEAPFPMTVTYRIDRASNGSLVSIDVGGKPNMFYGLLDVFMAPLVKASVSADLRRLQECTEGSP